MRRFALLLASTTFVAPALAADAIVYEEPPAPMAPVAVVAPASGWTGLYVGGHAGYAYTDGSSVQNFFITIPGTPGAPGRAAIPPMGEIAVGTPVAYSYGCGVDAATPACTLSVNGQVVADGLSRDELRDAVVALGAPADVDVGGTEGAGTATTVTVIPATPGRPAIAAVPAVPPRTVRAEDLGYSRFAEEDDGFVGGVHVGYDQEFGSVGSSTLVLGVVGDISYVDIERSFGFTNGVDTVSAQQELDYLATLRLRAGLAFGSILAYATGGLAVGEVDTTINMFGDAASESDTRLGYSVGGGLDFLVTENLSLGVEYLYTDLGSDDFSRSTLLTDGRQLDFSSDKDFDFHTVWAKASFRFN
ncbi:outer membrane beta-barrel protein [Aurantimonas aggregata]|uniref:Outer membrane beta-barrel protein n=1 Tax=Aurantimonas aggregata TaxID=2047720 RepID=A0A6L9MLU9_9HYPH|nr:outer membrane beta-barrel protein [Aurantimonas aggregata]NDV88823.1 outer membrane beta-barrel protein [Aurantimonas aggregata]